ncbi:Uncharacterized protein Rs2_43963 [Raphanus sativus]|nr:Uncharacterized protein Rs2_43963 [Raphanus sativus]
MASSLNEKKDSDVEMSEANQASPAQDAPVLTQAFVEGFSSFQVKMERRRADMESSVAGLVLLLLWLDSWIRCRFSSGSRGSGSWTRRYPVPTPKFQPLDPMSLCLLENRRSGASIRCPGLS